MRETCLHGWLKIFLSVRTLWLLGIPHMFYRIFVSEPINLIFRKRVKIYFSKSSNQRLFSKIMISSLCKSHLRLILVLTYHVYAHDTHALSYSLLDKSRYFNVPLILQTFIRQLYEWLFIYNECAFIFILLYNCSSSVNE